MSKKSSYALKQSSSSIMSFLNNQKTKQPLRFTATPQETWPHLPSQQPVFPFLSLGVWVKKLLTETKCQVSVILCWFIPLWFYFPPQDRKHDDFVILSEIPEMFRTYRIVPSELENGWVWNPFHTGFCFSKEKGQDRPVLSSFFVFPSSSFMLHLCIWCCLKQVWGFTVRFFVPTHLPTWDTGFVTVNFAYPAAWGRATSEHETTRKQW